MHRSLPSTIAMVSIIFFLLGVASVAAASVDDLMTVIQINEGYPLNIDGSWGRPIPGGEISTITFKKQQMNLDAIEITADETSLTMKAQGMSFEWKASTEGHTLFGIGVNHDIAISGTVDNFERRYAYGAPLETDADSCVIQISNAKANVEGKMADEVERQIKASINEVMCNHVYFFGSFITSTVQEVGFANLQQKSGKGAQGIKAMFGR